MINEIQKLTTQIVNFLSDKEGFKAEEKYSGVILDVTNPNGTVTTYDCYELLLYTLAVRKLGSDIELNINTDENGDKIFAINTQAKLDLRVELEKINNSFKGFAHDTILSVFAGNQTSDSKFPFCVMTLYKNGNWMRYDLVMAELLYAVTHDMKLELVDGTFVYPKLRKLSKDIQEQVGALGDK